MNLIEPRWTDTTIRFKCRTQLSCVENLVYTPTIDDLKNFFGGDMDEPHIMEMHVPLTFEPHDSFAARIAEGSHETTADLWFPKEIFCYDLDRALFECAAPTKQH